MPRASSFAPWRWWSSSTHTFHRWNCTLEVKRQRYANRLARYFNQNQQAAPRLGPPAISESLTQPPTCPELPSLPRAEA